MRRTILGLFPSGEAATEALDDLVRSGFDKRRIALVKKDERDHHAHRIDPGHEHIETSLQHRAAQLASMWAARGAGFGAIVGLVLSSSGRIAEASLVMAMVSTAGIGAGIGAVFGTFTAVLHQGIEHQATFLIMECDALDVAECSAILRRHHPLDRRKLLPSRKPQEATFWPIPRPQSS